MLHGAVHCERRDVKERERKKLRQRRKLMRAACLSPTVGAVLRGIRTRPANIHLNHGFFVAFSSENLPRQVHHEVLGDLWVTGKDLEGTCVRLHTSNSPVTSVQSTVIRCNPNPAAASGKCAIKGELSSAVFLILHNGGI
ncbi:lytic polysaccharide monooxygenase [Zalerion maritima]|uniref:Lytic polysaccharide monooxygenase n=1 Tax=Zalerion maritima TaxID=339359 RepID=A0AAD5RL18_9PEZI|nr:lytic polysaccharide monooxygenase [Zalerion maritima]